MGSKIKALRYAPKRSYMAKYVKCPRCDLNYILEGEDYCAVCKAELKIGPSLLYADDEDRVEEKLCPKCKSVYILESEDYCENCRSSFAYDIEPDTDLDIENDEKWRDFLDEDEKEEISNSGEDEEELISLSKIQEEEQNEFADEEEEDDEYYTNDSSDDDDDEFSYDNVDFDEDLDEDDEEEIEDEDEDF